MCSIRIALSFMNTRTADSLKSRCTFSYQNKYLPRERLSRWSSVILPTLIRLRASVRLVFPMKFLLIIPLSLLPTLLLGQSNRAEGSLIEPVTGMKFLHIPGGTFMMGSPSTEKGRQQFAENQLSVRVAEFWLAETEVTQSQWKAVMATNPSHFKGDNRPVEKVSWHDVQEFIKRPNSRTEKRFRLPTEAEWEYAARAGTRTARYWGERTGSNKANCYGCSSRWDNEQTAPVKSFTPTINLGSLICWAISGSGHARYTNGLTTGKKIGARNRVKYMQFEAVPGFTNQDGHVRRIGGSAGLYSVCSSMVFGLPRINPLRPKIRRP